jgi:hypothetical protein
MQTKLIINWWSLLKQSKTIQNIFYSNENKGQYIQYVGRKEEITMLILFLTYPVLAERKQGCYTLKLLTSIASQVSSLQVL